MSEKITVEIIYALPQQQDRVFLDLEPNTSALSALQQSGLIEKHQLDWADLHCGIFGRGIDLQGILQDQDRLEIYRPLCQDPQARRISKVTRKLPRRCI
ncbi:MAG: RnfH family protein [Gammaproteobacteria bacterium]|nr:RnfH family protein [Gammaproteobacteria bacterium]